MGILSKDRQRAQRILTTPLSCSLVIPAGPLAKALRVTKQKGARVGQRAYDAVAAKLSALFTISPSLARKRPRLRKRSQPESASRPAASVISRHRIEAQAAAASIGINFFIADVQKRRRTYGRHGPLSATGRSTRFMALFRLQVDVSMISHHIPGG
jgi:hypothetical protein